MLLKKVARKAPTESTQPGRIDPRRPGPTGSDSAGTTEKTAPSVPAERQPRAASKSGRQDPTPRTGANPAGRARRTERTVLRERTHARKTAPGRPLLPFRPNDSRRQMRLRDGMLDDVPAAPTLMHTLTRTWSPTHPISDSLRTVPFTRPAPRPSLP